MKISADVAELLRAGLSNAETARRLKCDPHKVSLARHFLRIPNVPTGPQPQPLQELIDARTRPVGDGHTEWTGFVHPSGVPTLYHRGRNETAHRVVFRLRYGREPVGKVFPTCEYPRCLTPDHIEDRPMRERNQRTFDAIFGRSP